MRTEKRIKMFDILTPEQMREAEQASVKLGVSLAQLMENAGEKLGREVLCAAQEKMSRRIIILAGSGNNGGDGFVCANFLAESGVMPTVILVCGQPKTELAKAVFDRLHKSIQVIDSASEEYEARILDAEIIVDCVFGTGFHGGFRGNASSVFDIVNASKAYKIACDIPSGANSLNGLVSEGTPVCNKTVTFHCTKTGMLLSPAKDYCGEVTVSDIGIPDGWEKYIDYSVEKPEEERIKELLPKRTRNSHKGTYGKLMLVCGCENYMGAAAISGNSALRSGVGITNLCTPKTVARALVSAMPECVFTGLECDEKGFITEGNIDLLIGQSKAASAIVIGCGLGVTEGTKKVVYQLIKNAKCPVIVDADGINCLSEHIDVLEEKQSEIILTPHPAELARLCSVSVSDIVADRLGYAMSLAKKYGVTVHAKGTQTITVSSDLSCYITDFGNSALAKGGSGDMLAGLIGSFTAQGVKPESACILASCLMGRSAEYLSESLSERGILARDIMGALPDILKEWEQ